MADRMTRERFAYLCGRADGLAGTVRTLSNEEAREYGRLMQELITEMAQLSGWPLIGHRAGEWLEPLTS